MEALKLSDKHTIYRTQYEWEYSVPEFLHAIKFNHENTVHTNNNSVWIEIEAPCFTSINNQVIYELESTTKQEMVFYAKHNWVYTQRKDFDMEWMHQHIFVHPPGRSKILADYTFTFYLQTTDKIKGDEGMIIFETEDKKRHKFLPKVGDIFIFPADLRHTAMPTPNSDIERIVYAGSYCMNIFNQNKESKSAI